MLCDPSHVTPANLQGELDAICAKLQIERIEDALRFPRFLQIETTRLCNARCPFCAVDIWDKSVPFMEADLFDKLAAEMAEHADWIFRVTVQKAGEPLLDRDIYQRVAKLKAIGIREVSMSTNASALTERNARRLLEAGVDDVMLSIDSVRRETYEKLRVGLDYDRVLDNIRGFFRLRNELRPEAVIRVRGVCFHDLEDPRQRDELLAWESFWGPLKGAQDRIYMKRAHTWGNQLNWDDKLDNVGDVFHPCIMPFSTMQISSSGKLALCPQDFDNIFDLGEVATRGVAEVWRDAGLKRIRALHAAGARNQIEMCRGCTLYDEDISLEERKNPTRFAAL